MGNIVDLKLRLTFTEDGKVTEKDKKVIIDNIIEALSRQVQNGNGIAPDEADYITEIISVKADKGSWSNYDVKENILF